MKKLIFALSVLSVTSTFAASMTSNSSRSVHAVNQKMPPELVSIRDITDQYDDRRTITLESLSQKRPLTMMTAQKGLSATMIEAVATVEAADVIVDKVINMGSKIWNVFAKGAPIATFHNAPATALPQNIKEWTELENWKEPQTRVMEVVYRTWKIPVVRFVYRITLVAGGSYHGVGNYIGYASVTPVDLNVYPLYTFDTVASVDNVYNKGSQANPVGAMVLNIRWTINNGGSGSHQFFLDGLGNIKMAAQK